MPSDLHHGSAALALALLRMEGVGRVAAGRLIERWSSLSMLRDTPREQVLLRLPGIAHADSIVHRVFDPSFDARLAEAEGAVVRMQQRQIHVLTPHHPDWPAGLGDLKRGDRPVVLYAYGATSLRRKPVVALLAQPPLEGPPFELAQECVRFLMQRDVVPATGLQHGFDTVVCKLGAGAEKPVLLGASCGVSRIPSSMRPSAAAAVRAGGLLISPFPVDHGPFPHDDHERARVLAALATAVVWVGAPAGSAEERALVWAAESRRPIFAAATTPGVDSLPLESGHLGPLVAAARGETA